MKIKTISLYLRLDAQLYYDNTVKSQIEFSFNLFNFKTQTTNIIGISDELRGYLHYRDSFPVSADDNF